MVKGTKSTLAKDIRVIKDKGLVERIGLTSDKVEFLSEVPGGVESTVKSGDKEFIIGNSELKPKDSKA